MVSLSWNFLGIKKIYFARLTVPIYIYIYIYVKYVLNLQQNKGIYVIRF